jgi:DnaK suppressor protein
MAQKAISKTPATSKKKPAVAKPVTAKKTTKTPAPTRSTGKVTPAPTRTGSAKLKPESAPLKTAAKKAPAPAAHDRTVASSKPTAVTKPTALPKPATAPKPAVVTKPMQASAEAVPAPISRSAAVPTTAAPEAPRPRKSGRGASKYFVAQLPTPLPPPTSRFADRFAPPRPPTRQMNNVELDVPRHAQKSDPKLANAWKSKSGRELTEAEVLAMPESEYMNEKQLDFFRGKLQALKDDLLSNAGETTEHLREDTSIVPDPADRATIEEEHALELRTRDRERKLLKKISQSLGRIESGDYGFCDETGEPIGLGRLIARPTATLSLEAQQRRELKQKMFGD